MENKDVGEFLVPCTTCTKNCFTIHGKTEEKESFSGCSYFFKVMLGDFAQKLRVPPAFVPKLLHEVGIDRCVLMQGPSGQQWGVKLCNSSNEMHFAQGWEMFVHYNKIQFGDFLVFKHVCKSYFKVKIFGRSGCQKIGTDFGAENAHQECNQAMDNKLSLDLAPSHLGKVLVKKIRGHPPKENQMETLKRRYPKKYYVSARRPVTEGERIKTLWAAQSFRSDRPFCLIVLKPSYVYNTIGLRFPNACKDRLQLPREKSKVILVDPNNKEWDVQYLGSAGGLCGGWKYFSFDNNLEEGDVCIFEQLDNPENKLKLRVHIFRVVEICTPYTWIKGRQINDNVPLLTNYSNESTKYEDPAINLSAKMFGPKVGLDAKEVCTDLAAYSSAKAFEPEEGMDIKGIDTVSRESFATDLSASAFATEQGRDAKEINTFSREVLTADLSVGAFGPEQGRDAKKVNTFSREVLTANFSVGAFGPEQGRYAKEVNTFSREDLSINMLATAFGDEQEMKQIQDAKQVNKLSREDLVTNLLAKAFELEQSENEEQFNSVAREDLSVNMFSQALGAEQESKQVQHMKQFNTISRENLATYLSSRSFGPEQRKDAKQFNSVSKEDLAIKMLTTEFGSEQQIKQVQDEKRVNAFTREDLSTSRGDLFTNLSAKALVPEQRKDAKQLNSVSKEDLAIKMLTTEFESEQQIKQVQDEKRVNAFTREDPSTSREDFSTNLSAKAFIPEQRKDTNHVISVLREDPAFNMSDKVLEPEGKMKQVQEKQNDMKTGRNKRAKCMLGISERKESCRRSPRLVQRNNWTEHPKTEHLCPASSVDGRKSLVKDTMLQSKNTSSLDPVKGYSEGDLMLFGESNSSTHGMPSNENLVLSEVYP